MKKLSCIFALLLWYCCTPAMAGSAWGNAHKGRAFVTLKQASYSKQGLVDSKTIAKFSIKLKFNYRKKAMRGDNLACPSAADCVCKAHGIAGTDLFFTQADYFSRPFFGHSKRGPPAIQ